MQRQTVSCLAHTAAVVHAHTHVHLMYTHTYTSCTHTCTPHVHTSHPCVTDTQVSSSTCVVCPLFPSRPIHTYLAVSVPDPSARSRGFLGRGRILGVHRMWGDAAGEWLCLGGRRGETKSAIVRDSTQTCGTRTCVSQVGGAVSHSCGRGRLVFGSTDHIGSLAVGF